MAFRHHIDRRVVEIALVAARLDYAVADAARQGLDILRHGRGDDAVGIDEILDALALHRRTVDVEQAFLAPGPCRPAGRSRRLMKSVCGSPGGRKTMTSPRSGSSAQMRPFTGTMPQGKE